MTKALTTKKMPAASSGSTPCDCASPPMPVTSGGNSPGEGELTMPSFDILSEVDLVALRNAVDVANRKISNRYDFKGTDARVEQSDKLLTLYGDSDFQLGQMKDILLPEMTAKKVDIRCLDYADLQKISGNKVKQEVRVRVGVEQELAKKIVKLLKDAKLKVQAAIQGDSVRVSGAKRDVLQEAIALVKKDVTDFPLQYGNFRD
jgi:uncharacterized protein YajQ (UPF0234 family)